MVSPAHVLLGGTLPQCFKSFMNLHGDLRTLSLLTTILSRCSFGTRFLRCRSTLRSILREDFTHRFCFRSASSPKKICCEIHKRAFPCNWNFIHPIELEFKKYESFVVFVETSKGIVVSMKIALMSIAQFKMGRVLFKLILCKCYWEILSCKWKLIFRLWRAKGIWL